MVKQPGPPEVLELVHDWPIPQLRDGEVSTGYPQCNESYLVSLLKWGMQSASSCVSTVPGICIGAMRMNLVICTTSV